ncbi:uncharacterized protein BXIN_1887 [Babesia sp. Xinjiang]|uniref:uncharacterized protein n=1 Tax=Babesia sp. Xinjiang TaxID=462227 RepID=UPI000A2223A1|nr:uncharacterized protein BXIN_1887 [Babesia sp. Xinjiang]ORM40341.1 hypothetical protein BXIN_1887 [Babesia sp. Xinjiang]
MQDNGYPNDVYNADGVEDGDVEKMERLGHPNGPEESDFEKMQRPANFHPDDVESTRRAESAVDAHARHEAMKDMNSQANEMRAAAERMKQGAASHETESKENTKETEVTRTVIPKTGEGNIIITNQTHASPRNEKEVDPMKELRSAVENLYQRARYKNLPVGEAGELNTPEQIYQSLNKLEYIIDGYRHTQLSSPNPDLNITEETAETTEGEPESPPQSSQEGNVDEGEDNAEDGRFLQTTGKGHKSDEPEDEDEVEDMDEDMGDYDDEQVVDDEEASQPEEETSKEAKGGNKMTPQEALDTLKMTITELVETLNSVVTTHTGVRNVLVHHSHNAQQVV